MPRPKGSKNRPRAMAPLPRSRVGRMSYDETLEAKEKIIKLISTGKATTIAAAAKKLGLDPVRVYQWATADKDFQDLTQAAREVLADELEDKLRNHANFIPQMMILKGYRPMFRENYRKEVPNEKLQELLDALRQLRGGIPVRPALPQGQRATDIVDATITEIPVEEVAKED